MANQSPSSRWTVALNAIAHSLKAAPRPAGPIDPREFVDTRAGSGIFGRWFVDRARLPAYQYDLNQYADKRARYPNSENIDRRDHWHQVGNDRVTALASNDGVVQLYLCDRGGVFLNRFEARGGEMQGSFSGLTDPIGRVLALLARIYLKLRVWWYRLLSPFRPTDSGDPRGGNLAEPVRWRAQPEPIYPPAPYAYSGGYSYLDDGTEAWATAYRYRPEKADTRRIFGMGYFETSLTHRNLRVTRHIYAPPGNAPFVLIDVTIENLADAPANVRHYEYWDVNVHQLRLQWFRTGIAAIIGDDQRRAINDRFQPQVDWDPELRGLRFHQEPKSPMPGDAPSPIDWQPADVFLVNLNLAEPAATYLRTQSFFGKGNAAQPDAVRLRRSDDIPVDDALDVPMPYCLVLRHDVCVPGKNAIRLRFAYGALRSAEDQALLANYTQQSALEATYDHWHKELAYFSTGAHPELQREMAWHAYNLLSATVFNEYYGVHLIPQGSAYLFSHGADGAPRDQGLFAIPLTYLRPALARETLQLIMRLTHADSGEIPYAFAGYGIHDGAGVHEHPSDLDLFFMLGLCEYLAATGHVEFLNSVEPYYPQGSKTGTVLDHVRTALHHLMSDVGLGPHGLLRVSDGDWSDSIVLETALRNIGYVSYEKTVARGESIPNSQMALYVLPRIAAIIQPYDGELAAQACDFAEHLMENVVTMWRSQGWFVRAILRSTSDAPVFWKEGEIDLEAQPWALISDLSAKLKVTDRLIAAIEKHLNRPSPIGATLTPSGMVWPAIAQLLTWGYARHRPDLAWRSLGHNTFAEHARHYPDVWINVWSGPDGVNLSDGRTWLSPCTPMTDFPVMNANQDALALLGLLRVCGIEPHPSGDGLVIAPQSPPERFVLDLPLLRLEVAPDHIKGEYRAVVKGDRVLHVHAPSSAMNLQASVNGQALQIAPTDGEVPLHLKFDAHDVVAFEVRWDAPER